MRDATLRLVRPEAGEADVLPFERRVTCRQPITGHVTTVCEGTAHHSGKKIGSIDLTDLSGTGLGAIATEAIPLGSLLTVFFPAHGPEGGPDATGRVVRCERREEGYEIGVRFERRHAA